MWKINIEIVDNHVAPLPEQISNPLTPVCTYHIIYHPLCGTETAVMRTLNTPQYKNTWQYKNFQRLGLQKVEAFLWI